MSAVRRVKRAVPAAALAIAGVALVLSTVEDSDAGRRRDPVVSAKPRPNALLLLNRRRQFPASAIPKVRSARNADRVGGRTAEEVAGTCNAESVDLGTWCLMANPFPVPNEDAGKNDYFYATQKCAEIGGYLPTAAQLVGAAPRVKLASTIDDDQLTASIDLDATDGLKDRREMSGTLITTAAGSSAAGSQGVSEGSRGDPRQGEPDPVPQPANPSPETLQYVTVYDNRDRGGFAGARPVGQAENFRCAFDKAPPEEEAAG